MDTLNNNDYRTFYYPYTLVKKQKYNQITSDVAVVGDTNTNVSGPALVFVAYALTMQTTG